MTDAVKQVVFPNAVNVDALAEGTDADVAHSRKQGGTGIKCDTVAELLDGLGRGAANGFAALDEDGIVPAEQLPPSAPPDVMVGAAAGVSPDNDGEQGLAPKPLANEHKRALRGDATYLAELELDKIFAPANLTNPACRFLAFDDSDNHVRIIGRGSGTHNARFATASSIDGDVDLRVDPKGAGLLTLRGDPVDTIIRGGRRLIHVPNTTTWHAIGLPTPTEWGNATAYPGVGVSNARGSYVDYEYPHWDVVLEPLGSAADYIGERAGLSLANIGRRQWNTSVIVTLEYQGIVNNRTWVGLFSGDPHLSSDPNTLSGIALRFSADIDFLPIQRFRSWSCNGGGTSTVKILDGTAPLGNMPATLITTFRILIRHVAGSGGKFQIWRQIGSDDGGAADGIWYLLSEHDANNGEFVPAGPTDLSLYVMSESLDGAASRSIRIKSVYVSEL